MRKTIPAVSIIIPMYNVEKYVGDCLDSILAQTFDDYEVILVDDCSTDNSVTIAESYLPKFNGKLQLIRSENNSGSSAQPRNIGIRFSRGEYIFLVDSDDAITETALEELYPIAKKFDADVVYCETRYQLNIGEKFTKNKALLQEVVGYYKKEETNFVREPTIISSNPTERIKEFISYKFYLAPWNYLIRRDLISTYDLRFPCIKHGDDNFWDLYIVCLAKKLVRVPNKVYIYRIREGSLITNRASLENEVRRYTDHVFQGVSIINKFAEKFPFLKEYPEYRYALFNFVEDRYYSLFPLYAKIPAWELEPLIIKELDKIEDKTALTAFLFAKMNLLTLNSHAYRNKVSEIMQKATKVIQQQQEIIQNQAAQIKSLQSQLSNVK